ncbi:hypothetical protein R3P38DRAFT_3387632 [Favolaschia claudopus]|uniref:Probable RNA polymerase II nuclear localization protein SLC7A6OS n=1 Tax=Favolaschia claudopus TaxID=2862362 RepID=A0AAW0D695_9AGAR
MTVTWPLPQPRSIILSPGFITSPFFNLFETDRIPSLQDRQLIRELVDEKKVLLAQLNSKVPKRRSWRKISSKLRVQLEETRRSIKLHEALIAPWRRLPVEMLSLIFEFTLGKLITGENDLTWDDGRPDTLLLCSVCSTWRAIALGTPALWNALSLDVPSASEPQSHDWVPTWLDRSRCAPLFLQVFWGRDANLPVLNQVVSTFLSHLHHTSTLWFHGQYSEEADGDDVAAFSVPTFPTSIPLDAPMLTCFGVDVSPDCNLDWAIGVCQGSPRLKELDLPHFPLDAFPISNLTRLQMNDPIPIATVFQMLGGMEASQFVGIFVEGPTMTPLPTVLVMKSLKAMEIASNEHLGEFLEQIAFPNVDDLLIESVDIWPDAQFHSSLSRSSCALTSLHLHNVAISESQIITCLQHKAMLSLQTLSLTNCDSDFDIPVGNALLGYLTYHDAPFPNPALKTLRLTDMWARDGLFSALVESRVRVATLGGASPPAALNSVFVESRRRKKSRGGVGVFQFAQTVENDAWEDDTKKRDIEDKISRLARERPLDAKSPNAKASPSTPKEDPLRRYKIIAREEESPSKRRAPTSPPKVISAKDAVPKAKDTGFKLYDAVLSGDKSSTGDEEIEKFMPMLQEYLNINDISASPSDFSLNENSLTSEPSLSSDDYVWDVFYHRPATLSEWNEAANVGTLTGLPPSITDPYDSASESEEEDEADEDSNAEEYYKNDYPEEEDSSGGDSDEFHEDSEDEFYDEDGSDHEWR